MPNLGGPELIIILLIFVLLFGAAKLPSLGRSMGQSITNFRKGINEGKDEPRVDGASPAAPADEIPPRSSADSHRA